MQLYESFGFQCLPDGYQYEWYSDVKDMVKIAGVTTGAEAEMWLQLYSEANKTTWRFRRGGKPGTKTVAYRVFTNNQIINRPIYIFMACRFHI